MKNKKVKNQSVILVGMSHVILVRKLTFVFRNRFPGPAGFFACKWHSNLNGWKQWTLNNKMYLWLCQFPITATAIPACMNCTHRHKYIFDLYCLINGTEQMFNGCVLPEIFMRPTGLEPVTPTAVPLGLQYVYQPRYSHKALTAKLCFEQAQRDQN